MKTIMKIWALGILLTLIACQQDNSLLDQDSLIENSTPFKVSFEIESETLQAQLISENNLSPIHDQASVVFKDKIWIIGGHTNGEASNTILNSNNGVKWNTVKTRSVFTPRRGHSVVVFKNKLWVFGGSPNNEYGTHLDDMSFYSDVWFSSDGVAWEKAAYTYPGLPFHSFQGRIDFGLVVFKGEIWAFGGFSEFSDLKLVQKSSDGIHWQDVEDNMVTQGLNGNQPIVFNNKLWLVGGYNWGGNLTVRSTSDGTNWEIHETAVPKHAHHQLVTDTKRMYLIAGNHVTPPNNYTDAGPSNHIWHTEDGTKWLKAKASPNFPKRTRHSSVYYKHQFWVIGGSNDNNPMGLSDVWTLKPIDPYTIDDLTFD